MTLGFRQSVDSPLSS